MDKARSHNRHHIPAPTSGTTQITANGALILADKAWLDGFKERGHELFLTLRGLPGHAIQVQQEFSRLSNSNLNEDRKRLLGDEAFEQLCKAAEHVGFDFPQQSFTVPSANRAYFIARTGGVVKGYKTVTD
jgi:hypothetical protein